MTLAREAYAVADSVRGQSPDTARRMRKAAVAVPSHVAAAVSEPRATRAEHVAAARDALEELARVGGGTDENGPSELARHAETLGLSILFEFADGKDP
jgi:hypothetical protein